MLSEQVVLSKASFEKVVLLSNIALVRESFNNCELGYLVPRGTDWKVNVSRHLISMWAGLEEGIPVLNGYSGLTPYDKNTRLTSRKISKIGETYRLNKICVIDLDILAKK